MNSFTAPPQNYWDNSYNSRSYSFAEASDPLSKWLSMNLPNDAGECLEVGICPGRYSQVISSKGYIINGIDSSITIKDLNNFLIQQKIPVNEMIYGDFLNYQFNRKFKTVISLGFIEHFKSWKNIIIKMVDLIDSGGYFVCEVPNFSCPIQLALRQELDYLNLRRHNLEAMNLNTWEQILKSKGFSILYQDAFGGFDFWVDNEPRTHAQIELLKNIQSLTQFLKPRIAVSDISYSPYIGMIARKD